MLFADFTAAPPDPILGLSEAFKNDPNPNKINLGVGVFKDMEGNTPIPNSVKIAEARLLQAERTKSYLPIDGSPEYAKAVQRVLFGDDHPIMQAKRAVTTQTPGGTGALRVAADFVRRMLPETTVWVSDPTWPNHPDIFNAARLPMQTYPYFDAATNGVKFDAMMQTVRNIPPGDMILIHGCCHNPTGVDLSPRQWQDVSTVLAERGILPLIDFAYQGFANGLREDAIGLLTVCDAVAELIICSSFSKNFGLYSERAGALTLVAADAEAAKVAQSHIKRCIRANYSNPPEHGSSIVNTVLNDPELRAQWEEEVTAMRDRINTMRHLFVETLSAKGATRDFSFIVQQRGMFSFSGLTPEQVKILRDKYAIYIVGNGRLNVAGMTESNMDYLCESIVDVLKNA
jgi:aspartate aminotransferase